MVPPASGMVKPGASPRTSTQALAMGNFNSPLALGVWVVIFPNATTTKFALGAGCKGVGDVGGGRGEEGSASVDKTLSDILPRQLRQKYVFGTLEEEPKWKIN